MKQHLKITLAVACMPSSCGHGTRAPIQASPVDDQRAAQVIPLQGDSTDYRLRHRLAVGDFTLRLETKLRCDSNYRYVPERNQLQYTGKENQYFQRCDEYGAIQCLQFFHQDTLVGSMDNRTILDDMARHDPSCCDNLNTVVERVKVLKGTKGVLYVLEAAVAGEFGLRALVDLRGSVQWYHYQSKINPHEEGDPIQVSKIFGINPPETAYSWDLRGDVAIDLYQ